MPNVLEKLEKPKHPNFGGKRSGSGRKASVEKVVDRTKKEAWNEYVVKLAATLWPKLENLTEERDPKVRLKTIELVFAYAYGKPKESVDVTSKGESITGINYIIPDAHNT